MAAPSGAAASGLLTVDRGNSTLDCRLTGAAGELPRRARLPVDDPQALHDFVGASQLRGGCGVSVVRGGLDHVEALLRARGVPLLVAGRDLPRPLATRYPRPAELGADRWVGAYAACRAHGDAVVVDCGTAVTVNAVDRSGCFLGGSIGAGLGTVAAALAARAPALPAFDAQPPVTLPAVSTLDAVRAGVGVAFAAGVAALVARCLAAFPASCRVVVGVTGGDARRLLRFSAESWAHWPDLVHDGLAALWHERPGAAAR